MNASPTAIHQTQPPESEHRRFRIAVFNYHLPRPGCKRGGVDRVAHDLADRLARRGHVVTVWTFDPKPEGAAYSVKKLPWERFCHSSLGLRFTMGYLGNFLALLPHYGDCDLVLSHGDSLLLPLRGLPVVRVMHGSALGEAFTARTPWRFLAQIGVYPQELLTALTQKATVGVSRNTRRFNPFVRHVIPLGIDLDIFHPNPDAKSPEPSILFVGTLDGRKRGRLLLDWYQNFVRPAVPEARLRMVSAPGPALPGVEYHSHVPAAELVRLYQSSWVYASPSNYEGFGLPYIEAMACGTPVIATPNPGSREVLEAGRYGILAEDENFGGEILKILQDPELRKKWTETGLHRVHREYAADLMVRRYEDLFCRVCDTRK